MPLLWPEGTDVDVTRLAAPMSGGLLVSFVMELVDPVKGWRSGRVSRTRTRTERRPRTATPTQEEP